MSRFRLYPTAEQELGLLMHCPHARYVWNLGVEQLNCWSRGKISPDYREQSRQLAEARAEFEWLRQGSCTVQQQALRDLDRARKEWWAGVKGRPTWRKKGQHEGFRITDSRRWHVKHLNKKWSQVSVPKIGWVKFRRTKTLAEAKSYRVTRDSIGRWHVAFAVIPEPIAGPCDGSVVGIDLGVAISVACSDGSTYSVPRFTSMERAARSLSRARRGSNQRMKTKMRLAKLHARDRDRRKDWIEKTTTVVAKKYDQIKVEELRINDMTRSARGTIEAPGRNVKIKSRLNRAILSNGWAKFVRRLGDKAIGRIERVNPAFTSQRCSTCGHVDKNSRKSQALFKCTACGYADNADVNAAKNIAAGRAVTAQGGLAAGRPVNCEPQLAQVVQLESLGKREDVKELEDIA